VFDHVTIRATDRDAGERFYAAVLSTLGVEHTSRSEMFAEWDDFSLSEARDERPVTRRLHIGFTAPSRDHVDEFWRLGTELGYRDDGEPGPRSQYRYDYYGSFLLDPDGNSVEAMHHGDMRRDGNIDHLWIRVADVAASRAFYNTIAPFAGLHAGERHDDRVTFRGASGSFTLLPGEPTENLHMAFPATTNDVVEAFHAAATGAGYRDNGAPGERPVYHEGYYAAFALDPDGNNIEVVNHNR
jgi:catechol 2,3-dioxygenase-like lactoylglutathione lyase family enzyme